MIRRFCTTPTVNGTIVCTATAHGLVFSTKPLLSFLPAVKIAGASITSALVDPDPTALSSNCYDSLSDSSGIMPYPIFHLPDDKINFLSEEEEKELGHFLMDAEEWL